MKDDQASFVEQRTDLWSKLRALGISEDSVRVALVLLGWYDKDDPKVRLAYTACLEPLLTEKSRILSNPIIQMQTQVKAQITSMLEELLGEEITYRIRTSNSDQYLPEIEFYQNRNKALAWIYAQFNMQPGENLSRVLTRIGYYSPESLLEDVVTQALSSIIAYRLEKG